jgi:hypothetical protein
MPRTEQRPDVVNQLGHERADADDRGFAET